MNKLEQRFYDRLYPKQDTLHPTNWWKIGLWIGVICSGIVVFAIVKANKLPQSEPMDVEVYGVDLPRFDRMEVLQVLAEDFGIDPNEVADLEVDELVELGEELCACAE